MCGEEQGCQGCPSTLGVWHRQVEIGCADSVSRLRVEHSNWSQGHLSQRSCDSKLWTLRPPPKVCNGKAQPNRVCRVHILEPRPSLIYVGCSRLIWEDLRPAPTLKRGSNSRTLSNCLLSRCRHKYLQRFYCTQKQSFWMCLKLLVSKICVPIGLGPPLRQIE